VKYLVTGAAGFIGSHLTRKLTMQGHEVTPVDNFTNYYDPTLKENRETHLINPLGLSVIKVNLSNPLEVSKLLESSKFDSVIHLAAQPGVRVPLASHDRYIESNLNAFAVLLSKVRERGIPNFLYASSSSVYGNNPDSSFSEIKSKPDPVSFYGATKLANEILASSGRHESATRTRGLRLFTVYGPWGRPDMAYFRLIASLLTAYKFQMYGDGSVRRDFTFIDDVTEIISKLDFQLLTENPGFSDVVNVGGGNPHSLNEMIQTMETLLGKKVHTNKELMNPNDVNKTCADPTYLLSLINYVPQTTLNIGIGSVVAWAQARNIMENIRKWSESVI